MTAPPTPAREEKGQGEEGGEEPCRVVLSLDALIRRLGEGITAPSSEKITDEEETETDEEDGGELAFQIPDHAELAKLCRWKVHRLIKRMIDQFHCAPETGLAHRAIIQLTAVLSIVRILKMISQRPEWKKKQLELVNFEDEWSLFQSSVVSVFWGPEALGSLWPIGASPTAR